MRAESFPVCGRLPRLAQQAAQGVGRVRLTPERNGA